ncbi:hypothetical protein ABT160_19320 [Streptomyces sp. NPDC001941]|uniref:hypothetical protein n=1 Tax=Streptomyces sp. NPDC001941 TaxID=3154659 RepID=UPI003331DC70
MTRTAAPPSRLAATAAVVLAALLGVLLCSGTSSAAPLSVPAAPAALAEQAGVAPAAAPDGAPNGAPGCGKGVPHDEGGVRPATPPRSSSAVELLPALHDARAADGAFGASDVVLALGPERAPPVLVPPSPMDLSILRV